MTDQIPWLEFSADLLFEEEADWPITGAVPPDETGVPPVVVAPVARVSVWTP